MRNKLANFIMVTATITGVIGVSVIAVILYFIEGIANKLKSE